MNGRSYNKSMTQENILKSMETILKVASDFTRLKILHSLFEEHRCHDETHECGTCTCKRCMVEKSVNDIVNMVDCSQSLVSHQLRVLKEHKLVKSRKEGTKVYYSLYDGHVKIFLKMIRDHILEE